jgi:hypothetical protein
LEHQHFLQEVQDNQEQQMLVVLAVRDFHPLRQVEQVVV